MSVKVEAVCCTAEECLAAEQAGAARIELCCALELGGLTPSVGLLERARRLTRLPLMAMIRPRPGNFVYSPEEIRTMEADIARLDAANGFVFGVLTDEGDVDREACAHLVRRCGARDKVFHRAFDRARDPLRALDALIELGFTRVLTSGAAPNAVLGIPSLSALHERAAGRIEILPGGGIRPDNAGQFASGPWSHVHLGPRSRTVAFDLEHESLDAEALRGVVTALAL